MHQIECEIEMRSRWLTDLFVAHVEALVDADALCVGESRFEPLSAVAEEQGTGQVSEVSEINRVTRAYGVSGVGAVIAVTVISVSVGYG